MDGLAAANELSMTVAFTLGIVGLIRRGWPIVPVKVFVLASVGAGLLSSLLVMLIQGDALSVQHGAYHVGVGLLASWSDKVLNLLHVGAEARKNNVATIPPASRDVV